MTRCERLQASSKPLPNLKAHSAQVMRVFAEPACQLHDFFRVCSIQGAHSPSKFQCLLYLNRQVCEQNNCDKDTTKGLLASLLGTRTLLGALSLTSRSKDATSNKGHKLDRTFPGLSTPSMSRLHPLTWR